MPYCELSFPTKAGLRYHLLKHKGQKALCLCSVPGCGRTFLTQAQLKQHENSVNYHKKINYQIQSNSQEEIHQTETHIDNDIYNVENLEEQSDQPLDRFFNLGENFNNRINCETQDPFESRSNNVKKDLKKDCKDLIKKILTNSNDIEAEEIVFTEVNRLLQENEELRNKLNKVPGHEDSVPVIKD